MGTASPSTPLDVVGSTGIRVNEDGSGTKVINLRSDFAGVAPAVNVSSNHPLLLMTNNTEQVRVDTSGRVGIGEDSPDTKLHIKNAGDADLKLENTSAGQTLRVDQNSIRTLTNSDIFIFCNDDSDNGIHLDASERTLFLRAGTNIASRYGRVNSMVTIGTSYVNVYDFANLGNVSGSKARGMYMVTVCREGASVGTHAHYIVGVSTGSNSYLYKILQNSGFVSPQISGSNLQLKISSGSVNCHVTVQPLGVHGAAS